MDFTKNVKPVTTVLNSSKQSDINKLAMELTTKLTQVDKLLVNLRAKTNNKEVKPYNMCIFSAFSETRNKGETTQIRNRQRKQRKRAKHRKRFQKTIESRKQHIKNLSDKQRTDEQISL